MSPFSDDHGAEMRELFFETSQELLQSLNDDALKLEKSPQDAEIIRSIRRSVHTLKGDAAACGFPELSELAHRLEDALAVDAAQSGVSLAELGFTAADVFSAMLVAYRKQTEMPETAGLDELIRDLAAGTRRQQEPEERTREADWTEYELVSARAAQSAGKNVFHVAADIDHLCAMPIAARQLVTNALGSMGEILATRPEPGASPNSKRLDLLVATGSPQPEVLAKCLIPTVIAHAHCFPLDVVGSGFEERAPAGVEEPEGPARQTRGASAPAPSARAESVLRVDAERIDNVLNLVGELIIAKSMLQQTVHEFSRQHPKDGLRPRFQDAMGLQARVLNDLQRSVMKIRMVPVEQLFRRFPRIVRDAAKRCEKQVDLQISGQDTDVDKGLLDSIAEPLTHIVRNAVSHGIESAEERQRAGKNVTGKIRLEAYHQANQLIVEVTDDGGGIDSRKILAKALKAKLISPQEAERMSSSEVFELIFRPGFSTAEEITEISGRGVGLDVVHSVLTRMKGTVELETQPGQFTRFRLKLPLTLAIIKALLFRIEQRLYAIPLNAVAEIARARASDLHRVDTTEVLQLRNQVLPLVRLGRSWVSDADPDKIKIFVLVLTFGDRKLGLMVDALEGEEELVIKSLDDQSIATDLVSGASILGDGRVVLIMNLASVMERFSKRGTDLAPVELVGQDRRARLEVRP